MEELKLDRVLIRKNAEDEDERSNLKQHADKMIRGFENFNEFSSNRAIWELVQNACDLSNQCEVTVDYRNEGISFTHNGKPFTTKSLISLIKQVSGKYGDAEEIPEVGKYGTGFITTHSFGRKFKVDSVLQANGIFLEIKDFLIDRSPKEWYPLSENIRVQKNSVFDIIDNGVIISKPEELKTTFTYLPETDQERTYIKSSSEDLADYTPLVLTINDRLSKFTIIDSNGDKTVFERVSKEAVDNERNLPLFKTIIQINSEDQFYYSLIDNEIETEVILPINKDNETFEFGERIARLFLYYPLIGSESFGFNYIVNSKKFMPTEPRDGIHLMSNKDQVKDQEEENRSIIERTSRLIFSFLKCNIIPVSNPLLLVRGNFKTDSDNINLNDYFAQLKKEWSDEFKELPILQTNNAVNPNILVKDGVFFHQDLLDFDSCFDEVYELAQQFYPNIPIKDKVILWSKYADEWGNESLTFINHDNLVEEISNRSLSDFKNETLKTYYSKLIEEEKEGYFSNRSLLPNNDGVFKPLTFLLVPSDIEDILIEVGKVLIPESMDLLIHSDFKFDFTFETFNRKHFSNKIKEYLDGLEFATKFCTPKEVEKDDFNEGFELSESPIERTHFEALLKLFRLSNNLQSSSKPIQLVQLISQYYGWDDELIKFSIVDAQEDRLDVRSSRKVVAQSFFNLLQHHSAKWVEENLHFLFNVASCKEDSLKEAYTNGVIYPSQSNKLKKATDLKRDIELNGEITNLYERVTQHNILDDVVYPDFNDFIEEDRFVNNKYLAVQIEETLFETDILSINEHPFGKVIIGEIIPKLDKPFYKDLFPRLDDKKATLMMEVLINENTKDDLFSIVTLEENQLKKLGKLVQKENFESILAQAERLIQLEIEKKADFQHKYKIGTDIERLIREKLSSDLSERVSLKNESELGTEDIQGGQDIIVLLDNKPFYFIEVKSRWKSDASVSLSKLQLERSVEESKRFALCSVDVSKYSGALDRYKLPIDEILPLTKFVRHIGEQTKPLIEDNLRAEASIDSSVHLIEYRGIVPQKIIQEGESFSSFLDYLITKLETAANGTI